MKRTVVIRILSERHAELHTVYAVKMLALFGSVARDEDRPESNVDLLVEFSHPVGLFEYIGLKQYLESPLNCPVDLSTVASLKPCLKERVLPEMIHVT